MIATEAKMAQILVRNLEDQVRADYSIAQSGMAKHGREVREILRNALREEETPKRGLGSEIVALFSGHGIGLKEGEEIPEIRGMRMRIRSFSRDHS